MENTFQKIDFGKLAKVLQDVDFSQIKTTKFETAEIKAVKDDDNLFEITISANSVDRYDEIVDQDGMDIKAYRNNPVVLWSHNYGEPPIGRTVKMWKESGKRQGLMLTKAQFEFAPTPFAQEIKTLVKGGFINVASIGFMMIEYDRETKTHKKYELLEWSLCSVQANRDAHKGLLDKAKELGLDLIAKSLEESFESKEKSEKMEALEKQVEDLKKELSLKDEEIAKLNDKESAMDRLADKVSEKIKAAVEALKTKDNGDNKQGDEDDAQLIKAASKALNAVLANRNKRS